MEMSFASIILLLIAVSCLLGFAYIRRWKKYDPRWIVELAEEQLPNDVELHNAIRNCTKIRGSYFVNADKPNQPGSDWQFEKSVTLVHPEMDDIILDVLKDGRIGSIEYLGLMCSENST